MLKKFDTKGGITVHRRRTALPMDRALDDIYSQIDEARGALFASDYEYPGRYSRWDIGFVDPPLEIISKQRDLVARALNDRGRVILEMLEPAIRDNPHVEQFDRAAST